MILVDFNLKTNKVFFHGKDFQLNPLKSLGFIKHTYFTGSLELYLKHREEIADFFEVKETDTLVKILEINSNYKTSLAERATKYLDTECPFKLKPFQREFVYWYLSSGKSCFNACEAGTGKTIMSLAAVLSQDQNTPLIIVCPKNAVGVWKEHLEKFKYSLPILTTFNPGNCACILTYESLPPIEAEAKENKAHIGTYKKLIPKNTVLICDEFHKCKNAKALKTLRWKELFKLVNKTIALTATPIMNRPEELKTLLSNLDLIKSSFGTVKYFNELFGIEYNLYLKRNVTDPNKRNSKRIKEIIKDILFIYKKEEVLSQLPKIINKYVYVENLRSKENIKELNYFENKYNDLKDLLLMDKSDFVNYTRIRQALSIVKIKETLEIFDEFEEIEKPVIAFSSFTEPLAILAKRNGWAKIDGSVSANKRKEIVNKFNNGELKGIAINIKSGSEALSITGTDTAVFIDLELNPGANYQARQRIDRISKQNESLTYVYIKAKHPFEARVDQLLLEKEKLNSETC